MWILGVLGTHIQVTYDAAGYLVDAAGNWYETDGGQVFNDLGEYVGQLQTTLPSLDDAKDWGDEKIDLIISEGGDAFKAGAIAAAIAVPLAALVGFWLIYKVVK